MYEKTTAYAPHGKVKSKTRNASRHPRSMSERSFGPDSSERTEERIRAAEVEYGLMLGLCDPLREDDQR